MRSWSRTPACRGPSTSRAGSLAGPRERGQAHHRGSSSSRGRGSSSSRQASRERRRRAVCRGSGSAPNPHARTLLHGGGCARTRARTLVEGLEMIDELRAFFKLIQN
ncbi:hypothetical protein FOA52_013221 [Chlamydomonas sp. UWO 241]|nr:hypothetical protein FOA52_013221 [Chlamydomonas sp. UWO 241]